MAPTLSNLQRFSQYKTITLAYRANHSSIRPTLSRNVLCGLQEKSSGVMVSFGCGYYRKVYIKHNNTTGFFCKGAILLLHFEDKCASLWVYQLYRQLLFRLYLYATAALIECMLNTKWDILHVSFFQSRLVDDAKTGCNNLKCVPYSADWQTSYSLHQSLMYHHKYSPKWSVVQPLFLPSLFSTRSLCSLISQPECGGGPTPLPAP